MKGPMWEVEYELKKYFTNEKAARRFYKKTAGRADLKLVMIRHRIKDNAERIVNRIMEKLYLHPELGPAYRKLTGPGRTKVRYDQFEIVTEILKEILK